MKVDKALEYAAVYPAHWLDLTPEAVEPVLTTLAAEVVRLRKDSVDPLYHSALSDRARLATELGGLREREPLVQEVIRLACLIDEHQSEGRSNVVDSMIEGNLRPALRNLAEWSPK